MTDWLGPFAFLLPSVKDVVQIALVAVGFYYVLRLLARTRAIQMLIGVVLLALVYLAARLLDLELVVYIMEKLFQYGAIAALIVFQPELRSALARLGQSRMVRLFGKMEESEVVEELVDAIERLARGKVGAIIALERSVGLDEYALTGTPIDAKVSAGILSSIFAPYGIRCRARSRPWSSLSTSSVFRPMTTSTPSELVTVLRFWTWIWPVIVPVARSMSARRWPRLPLVSSAIRREASSATTLKPTTRT